MDPPVQEEPLYNLDTTALVAVCSSITNSPQRCRFNLERDRFLAHQLESEAQSPFFQSHPELRLDAGGSASRLLMCETVSREFEAIVETLGKLMHVQNCTQMMVC